MADTKVSDEMPFTKLVREAEAADAKMQAEQLAKYEAEHRDTPEWVGRPPQEPPAAQEKLTEAPLIKFMLEQDAAVARDHADGRISDADYQSYRELSETRIADVREHLQESGKDMVEGLREWAGDAKDTFEQLKEEHPDLVAELESGHPKLETVADTLEAIEVVHPLLDTALDGVDQMVGVVGDDLPSMARDLVDARAQMEGVDSAEIEAAQAKLESVTSEFEAKIEDSHESIDAAREKIDADFEAFGDAVDQMHDYAEAHPDAEVIYQIHDAQIDEEIEEETGVVDA
jgi:exonuclease VII small subunit